MTMTAMLSGTILPPLLGNEKFEQILTLLPEPMPKSPSWLAEMAKVFRHQERWSLVQTLVSTGTTSHLMLMSLVRKMLAMPALLLLTLPFAPVAV